MLPRLQELHDEDRCLIFFATNNSDKVDPAIKRPGRFDFRVLVNHPTRERVLEYLESPSKRAYTDIGIKVDEATRLPKDNGKELFREIAGPVKDAVTEVFTVEGAKVKFKFVEDALRKVAAVIADGLEGEKLLKKRTEAAVKSLQDSAKREEASQREPPDLQ
jgi:ATP-dependent 26S proteasome regulatory subunit